MAQSRKTVKTATVLRAQIIRSLRRQGYSVRRNLVHLPPDPDKETLRALHETARSHKLELAKKRLQGLESQFLSRIAAGMEVDPQHISPKLRLVKSGSFDELLFRYLSLHWSIPVSSGYGRRLRFLVFDDRNDKVIGLFGLNDPVFSLRDRDSWVGWSAETRAERLYYVMDAYVLGAVPPYSALLCGKLVALLALSNEVRDAFRKKYTDHRTKINHERRRPYLAMITTTSALGRSSVYNRIKVNGLQYWRSLGFTQGSGEFHFSNGLYRPIHDFVSRNCEPTWRRSEWGEGFRNRREVIQKCLRALHLPDDLLYHGVRREIFAAPLGRNALAFLKGERKTPAFFNWPAKELFQVFRERWLLPRAARNFTYRSFKPEEYRLWSA